MALTTQQKIYIGVSGLVVCCIAIIIAGVATNWFAPASTSSATNTMCSLRSGAKIITDDLVDEEYTKKVPGKCAATANSKSGKGWMKDSDSGNTCYKMADAAGVSEFNRNWVCPTGKIYYSDTNAEYCNDPCSNKLEDRCDGACQWNPAE